MTEYICKYAPVELLAGFGEEAAPYNLSARSLDQADRVMHRNVCGFSRALLSHRLEEDGGALVLTDCCDSIRRAYDVLAGLNRRVFLLDLPHKDGPCARALYRDALLRFSEEFAADTGRRFQPEWFRAACGTAPRRPEGPYLAVTGARLPDGLLAYLRTESPLPVFNRTCTGLRSIGIPPETGELAALMDWYAGELLSQTPCMRMTDVGPRRELTEDPCLEGLIYHTVSFCDYYGLEYARLREALSVPVLKLETDYTDQSSAQVKTRLDAFLERLRPQKKGTPQQSSAGKTEAGAWYAAGIDSGSTSTNAVILNSGREVTASAVLPTGVSVPESAKGALDAALKAAGISRGQLARTVTTGYGRTGTGLGGRDITEITCHAKGAQFLRPEVRTVIDIGGQDSKVIRLNGEGGVRDFAMNDKCAAGTGRFLEMMAQSLGVTLEELAVCGLHWNEEVTISSMCSVFAQSEVVSLIAAGKKLPDIVHGLNCSVAAKVISLSGRMGTEGEYMMTGGVARNAGVVGAVEARLGRRVLVPREPELCGALGAALLAWEDAAK